MTHPALQKAMDACRPLSAAAHQLGAADPLEVLAHIDCDPEAIRSYAEELRVTIADLDKAIDQEKATIAELKQEEGEGSEAAIAEAEKELAELETDRKELVAIVDQISRVAGEMEQLVISTSEQICGIANGARPAAEAVAAGTAEAEDEERVIKAINEIIGLAQHFQQQVDQLREKFKSLLPEPGEAEAGSGSPGSAEGGTQGGAEGGVEQGGGAEGGTQGGSEGGVERGDGGEGGVEQGGGAEGGVGRGGDGEGQQAPSGGAGAGGGN
ncbi:hypothetical protein [Amycolatopsis albispora]|uniref:Methyl-accepting transducer domain-containing protein n=1 Tax=Amycolatopsis albispora TaxID=1804986 RepID=A0A344LF22_9PSEU|nr:hypothetical protein [Amycolatopsis albispora]AXB46646.1 hypothetical protein A4R43_32890 [Amycolatopsis albispora]